MMAARRGNGCSRSMARILAAVTMVLSTDSTTVISTMSNGLSVTRDMADSWPTTEVTSSADRTRAQTCPCSLALSTTRTLRTSDGGSAAKQRSEEFSPGKHEPLNGLESVRWHTKSARRQFAIHLLNVRDREHVRCR